MILPGIGATGVGAVVASGGGSGGGVGSVSISDQSIIKYSIPPTTASYRLTSTGNAQKGKNGTFTTLETWLLSGVGGDYDAYVTVTGAALFSGTVGSWVNLASTQTWTLEETISGVDTSTTLDVQIRQAVSPFTVLDTASIFLLAGAF